MTNHRVTGVDKVFAFCFPFLGSMAAMLIAGSRFCLQSLQSFDAFSHLAYFLSFIGGAWFREASLTNAEGINLDIMGEGVPVRASNFWFNVEKFVNLRESEFHAMIREVRYS